MAKAGQGGLEAIDGIAATRKQGAAARGTLESALLRRYRHADRRRRHLVLPEDADRAAGFGQIVRIGAQTGRRQVFPGHAGRKGRDRRRRRAVPRRGNEDVCRRGWTRVLQFRTNVDDWVAAGPGHALRFELQPANGGLKPYLHVRRELWAKVTRALFYDLVALGEEREVGGKAMFGVVSGGEFFAMAEASALREFA